MNNTNNKPFVALYSMVKRNVKLYMKDKMMVFFSLIAPIVVLLLYICFFTNMQVQSIDLMLKDPIYEGVTLTTKEITAVINNWMIAGVIGISCITVAFNANTIMIRDRERGSINDVLSSPVKRWMIYISYVISCFVITFTICFCVLLFALIYLACTGGFMMTFLQLLAILGTLVLSTLSSALFCTLFVGVMKSEGALTAVSSVFSTVIGFLVGAYLPMNMMPKIVEQISVFIPGTYSIGLFRRFFLVGPIGKLSSKVPENVMDVLLGQYSLDIDFFGHKVNAGWMTLVLIISIVVFAATLLIVFASNKKNIFAAHGGKRKASKKKKLQVQRVDNKNETVKVIDAEKLEADKNTLNQDSETTAMQVNQETEQNLETK